MTGPVDGKPARLGRPGWIEAGELGQPVAAMQEAGATAVLVEYDGVVIGAVAVRDDLLPDAAAVVARLCATGSSVALPLVDNERPAVCPAAQAGSPVVHGHPRPADNT